MVDKVDIDLSEHVQDTAELDSGWLQVKLREHDKRLDCHDRKFGEHADIHTTLWTGIDNLHIQLRQQAEWHQLQLTEIKLNFQEIRKGQVSDRARREELHSQHTKLIKREGVLEEYRMIGLGAVIVITLVVVLWLSVVFK